MLKSFILWVSWALSQSHAKGNFSWFLTVRENAFLASTPRWHYINIILENEKHESFAPCVTLALHHPVYYFKYTQKMKTIFIGWNSLFLRFLVSYTTLNIIKEIRTKWRLNINILKSFIHYVSDACILFYSFSL